MAVEKMYRKPKEVAPNDPLVPNVSYGDVEFELMDGTMETPPEDEDSVEEAHYDNLAGELDPKILTKIGNQCKSWFEKDLESRSEWEETITKGTKTLGINIMETDEPFEGACGATHPLILEAAVKFQSKATAELLPASGPVRTQVLGDETEEKIKKANRVKEFLNYQITRLMPEYYPDMEKLLFYLPLMGSSFKKTYWDMGLDRPISCFIEPFNFVISDKAKSITKARRYSEVLPPISGSELHRRVNDGELIYPKEWRDNLKNEPGANTNIDTFDVTGDSFAPGIGTIYQTGPGMEVSRSSGQMFLEGQYEKVFTLIEQHCYLAMPAPYGEIGYTDPYIVTFLQDTGEVLGIRRNWKEGDINKRKIVWYSHYSYVPGFGFYGLGLFHLLGNFQITLTSIIRSLVDAGQFANLQGGLKLKGLRITGDNSPIAPGEWKEVESAIQDISKALFPLPYKEPSQVLSQLLQWLDGRAGSFADSTEQVIGDSTNYGPVGTTVALLEASMKLFSAIHKRTHLSQEQDLKLLAEINYEYMPEEYPYDVPGESRSVFRTDFDPKVVGVIPVSNPNVTSNAHRMAVAQAKLQAAQLAPQLHNMKKVLRDFYLALGEENIDALVPPDQVAAPLSPLEDVIALTQGKPIKAFPGQNHKAHVEFKAAWLQDKIIGGASPTMQQFVPHVTANIREHQIAQFQEQVSGMIQGSPNEDPNVIAQVQAEAAQEVKKANEALASVLGGNDPLQIVAQAEMLKAKTEAERVSHVKVKDLASLALQAQKLDIDAFLAKIKGKEVNMDVQLKQFQEGLKSVQMGIDNLMREAEMAQGQELEKAKANTEKVKLHGIATKNRLDAQGKAQKNFLDVVGTKAKLTQQSQVHNQKLAQQRESAQEKINVQRESNKEKLNLQRQLGEQKKRLAAQMKPPGQGAKK